MKRIIRNGAWIALGVLLVFVSVVPVNLAFAENRGVSRPALSEHAPAVAERTKLAQDYEVSDGFIQNELDRGYTLSEVEHALRTAGGPTGSAYKNALAKARKQPVNLSAQAKSTIIHALPESFGSPSMSLLSISPSEPFVQTKPSEAPFQVNLGNETVSTLSGALTMRETDLVLPGRNGLGFALTRIYNSESSQFYPFDTTTGKTQEEMRYPIGKGWKWELNYIENTGGKTYLHLTNGGTYEFKVVGTAVELQEYPWEDLVITLDSSVTMNGIQSTYKVKNLQNISQYFDNSGRLLLIEDAYNNQIQFHYDIIFYGTHNLILLSRIVDAAGNIIAISYSQSQVVLTLGDRSVVYKKVMEGTKELLSQVIDPLNRVTTYDYEIKTASYGPSTGQPNPYALLTGVTYPTGAKSLYTYETPRITRYFEKAFWNQFYRIQESKLRVFYADTTTEDFNVKTFTYNGDMASAYNADYAFDTVIDDGLTQTKFIHKRDYLDDETMVAYYNTQVVSTAGSQQKITDYTYDETRRNNAPTMVASQTVNTATGEVSPIAATVQTYDDYGNILTQTNPLNATTTYTYNVTSHLLESVSEPIAGGQTRYTAHTRNTQGTVTQTRVRETNASGTLLQQIDYEDIDAYGNVQRMKLKDDARDITTNLTYNGAHQNAYLTQVSMSITDADNVSSTVTRDYEYNIDTGTLKKATDGKGYITQYQYDALGRITQTTQPDLSTIQVTYDDMNNKLLIRDELGITAVAKWNPLGWKTEAGIYEGNIYKAKEKYGYDAFGRQIWAEDALGNRTEFDFDVWGRTNEITYADNTVSTTLYDDILNKISVTDAESYQTIETYDVMGRVVKQEEKKAGGTPTTLAEYVYDTAGNVRGAKDAKQQTTSYVYDTLGQLTAVTNANQETTSYTYSMAGNLTRVTYPDQTYIEKEYDEAGRLVKKYNGATPTVMDKYYYDANGNVSQRVNRKNETFNYDYNNRNLLVESQSDGETITFTYDAAGKRLTMTDDTGPTVYSYHPLNGLLNKVTTPDNRYVAYTYDANGNRTQMRDPFGGNVYYEYDALNRLAGVGTGGAVNEADYMYEDNGLLSQIQRKNGVTSTYTYDGMELDTLTHRQADNSVIQSFAYSYDANGNIDERTENGLTNSFTYDPLNRVETSDQFSETYAYDSKGNRVSYARNQLFENDNTELEYDDWDRLTEVSTASGDNVTYRYNGNNLLYERTENGETIRYYYDGDQMIAEAKVVGGQQELIARYVRGQGLITTADTHNNTAYYLHNGHGDVVELRDETGNTRLNSYSYDIWGNPVTERETVRNSFRYAGEMWDNTTSLQYLRARWYDPSDGRFINEDTYEGQIDNPLTLNLYTYVHNNPLRYTDPTGHIIKVSGTEAEQQTILTHLQQLTDHTLGINADGELIIVELANLNELKFESGNLLLARMMLDDNTTTILIQTEKGNYMTSPNWDNASNGIGSDATVYFNPYSDPNILTEDPATGNVSEAKRPAYIGLAHEMIHADRAMRGAQYELSKMGSYRYQVKLIEGKNRRQLWSVKQVKRREELATVGLIYVRNGDITENDIRKEHGLSLRGGY